MTSNDILARLRANRGLTIGLAAALVFVLAALSVFGTFNRIQKDGVARETRLTSQYADNQNELATLISNFYEQLGIADAKSGKMDAILSNAIRGRYDDTGVEFGGGSAGAMFSAMVEAYPNLEGLDIYDQVATTVAGGREAYKQKQTKLLDMLREYDTWAESGIIHAKLVDMAGRPGDTLRAPVGDQILTGPTAREQMYRIVLNQQARDAYESATLEPLQVPGQQ